MYVGIEVACRYRRGRRRVDDEAVGERVCDCESTASERSDDVGTLGKRRREIAAVLLRRQKMMVNGRPGIPLHRDQPVEFGVVMAAQHDRDVHAYGNRRGTEITHAA